MGGVIPLFPLFAVVSRKGQLYLLFAIKMLLNFTEKKYIKCIICSKTLKVELRTRKFLEASRPKIVTWK